MAVIRLDNGRSIVTSREVSEHYFDLAVWHAEHPDWTYVVRRIDDGNTVLYRRIPPDSDETTEAAFLAIDRAVADALTPARSANGHTQADYPMRYTRDIREIRAAMTPEERTASAVKARETTAIRRQIDARRWPAERVRALRAWFGESQTAFGRRVKAHGGTVSGWELGGRPTRKRVQLLDELYARYELDILATYPDAAILPPEKS